MGTALPRQGSTFKADKVQFGESVRDGESFYWTEGSPALSRVSIITSEDTHGNKLGCGKMGELRGLGHTTMSG